MKASQGRLKPVLMAVADDVIRKEIGYLRQIETLAEREF